MQLRIRVERTDTNKKEGTQRVVQLGYVALSKGRRGGFHKTDREHAYCMSERSASILMKRLEQHKTARSGLNFVLEKVE